MIAIHHLPGSFSDHWEKYCAKNGVPFIAANLFGHDIVQNLERRGILGVLFNLTDHTAPRTRLAAKAICQALELGGIRVFPNHATYWHCDDKIAQHYLLESLKVPRCQTYVYYEKDEALRWVAQAQFPMVFKLRCGAGSSNVRLARTRRDAEKLVARMFGHGIQATPRLLGDLSIKVNKHRSKRDWLGCILRIPSTLASEMAAKASVPPERGYVYFQEFLSQNAFDTRVTVIGERAFAFRRFVRPNDFRASGSGRLDLDPDTIDLRCVTLAFETARRVGAQCLALDFVHDEHKSPVVLEMCYTFVADVVFKCPGHWDTDLHFHCGHKWPQDAIIEDFLAKLNIGLPSRHREMISA